ncbi:macrolide transporter, partial [Klebsiella pneumoniae]|nr:macrolide transporter [Salmonella enterica subsp. enterica serovar Typhimurium]EES9827564.1 macrolide transporter [Escherichia coli]EJC4611186.1 macrolide transporter [Salmonella enterica]EEW0950935.1 macrolide transporter [Escherichia coli]EFO4089500.1 macrolide transporter [Escherichia coli]
FFWSGVALIVNAVLCRILTRRYDKVTMKPQVD